MERQEGHGGYKTEKRKRTWKSDGKTKIHWRKTKRINIRIRMYTARKNANGKKCIKRLSYV